MKAAHRLIRLDLWGKNGREGHRAQIELLGDPDQIFAMPSDSRIPIHLFGERYETIPKRRENCDEPEEYVAGYTEVFYTDGLKAEQGSGASAFQVEKYAIPRSGTYFA